jgi:hypothetical protein
MSPRRSVSLSGKNALLRSLVYLFNLLWSAVLKTARTSPLIQWTIVLVAVLSLASCGGSNNDSAVATVFEANRSTGDNAFTATLTGVQEAPPTSSLALGAGTVIIDPNTRLLRATVTTAGITGIAAHIHEAPPGLSGPIITTLSETSAGSGIWTAQATLTDTQLNALRAGNYYFNVQSATHPRGEISGQILPRLSTPAESGVSGVRTTAAGTTAATVFKNALTGTQEVPATSSTATAIGSAAVDHVAKTLTVAVNTIGIAGTEAHVREAAPGVNGPIVFPLAQTSGGSGIWFGKAILNDTQINSIMAGNYYIEVRSAAFPNGEVRGQIAQLQRRSHLNDCRFGGFGFDDCTFDGAGFFVGFGLAGFGVNDFGPGDSGFDGFGFANGGTASGAIDGGAIVADTPAPGFFF